MLQYRSEDRQGHPFVGPAGNLLRDAMREAAIDPAHVYITNAVKHFKFVERGKRRIHASPKRIKVRACEPRLVAEIEVVRPRLVVALGATAAQALLGPSFRVTAHRELVSAPHAERVVATVHAARRVELSAFVDDLKIVARLMRDA
ncbi:hypothetical protein WPS_27570 [Vulcanimicrobium alpinum]|uniref:Uracil-DNA glycosylase-like domain-containing protein n=1 Tax=Vulcanimicrobium alpinum TaxID=3016050 RepID=A0AAN2CAU2_UNVUL|nr:uracil-DNA glycosylase family protein [Vulcanimicrobium alpinum]BDE07481.1 hypothetical protein WPS_27570 [Vulcanimicrobium alpinum]